MCVLARLGKEPSNSCASDQRHSLDRLFWWLAASPVRLLAKSGFLVLNEDLPKHDQEERSCHVPPNCQLSRAAAAAAAAAAAGRPDSADRCNSHPGKDPSTDLRTPK